MSEPIDAFALEQFARWADDDVDRIAERGSAAATAAASSPARFLAYFEAQLQSRHLDFAARWLQSRGEGFYTIGSNGHESNAAVAMALRPTDPALLHYRSGGFFAARAAQVPGTTPIRDVLLGMAAGSDDPISGGRHKVFGHPRLSIIPQTSTIGSHLPRAFGLAYSLANGLRGVESPWPDDAVVVTSFGDASLNHSTVTGALNAIDYCARRRLEVPILIVCEDNGIGISTKSPPGWVARVLSRYDSIAYIAIDGTDPHQALTAAERAAEVVRVARRPVAVHLRTVRFGGHAGSDAEIAYRNRSEIRADYERDPLLGTARTLLAAKVLTAHQIATRYEAMRTKVMAEAESVLGTPRLSTAEAVMRPLTRRHADSVDAAASRAPVPQDRLVGKTPPEEQGTLTLAQSINAALGDVLATWPQAMIFGEDVGRKGGVYGLTRTLAKRFGSARVFDTVLDEQTILGTALGGALNGLLPIPEIQYLAYLHNAEDQIRGEAATLAFFSDDQYRNPMVVRIAGLAYQKGFGGHFHNDNSIAVLRDIPGIVVAVPSHPRDAPAMLRTCMALAHAEGRVCVFLEPIALYHARDLHEPGDDLWTAAYDAPDRWASSSIGWGEVGLHGDGGDVLVVTFGNGVPMSLRAARRFGPDGGVSVLDLRWLHPLPTAALLEHARRFDAIVVADETRQSGGVSEGVVTALVDAGYPGRIRRVTSRDSVIPLGPAADTVLLDEQAIVEAIGVVHSEIRRIPDQGGAS